MRDRIWDSYRPKNLEMAKVFGTNGLILASTEPKLAVIIYHAGYDPSILSLDCTWEWMGGCFW